MKFELKQYHQNISEEEVIEDMKRVAELLNKSSFTISDYQKHGKYHNSTLSKKFGSWKCALNSAGLNYSRKRITNDELLEDLKNTAVGLNVNSVSKEEYQANGSFRAETIQDRFGGWVKALKLAGLEVNRDCNISEELLMENILEVWQKLGKQPTYKQIAKPLSKYSTKPYVNKYGTWLNALNKFIEYVNSFENPLETSTAVQETRIEEPTKVVNAEKQKEATGRKQRIPRYPSLKLRFQVFKRDNFKCVLCGQSPAKNPKIELEADHIYPWSKGGETTFENLQTLCSECNGGKSDLT